MDTSAPLRAARSVSSGAVGAAASAVTLLPSTSVSLLLPSTLLRAVAVGSTLHAVAVVLVLVAEATEEHKVGTHSNRRRQT